MSVIPVDLGTDEFVDLIEIGRGGFGQVYRASQPAFGRVVAVKVLNEIDEATERRFERERKALGLVSHHPHIPQVFASGFTSDRRPYLAMEFMEGGSLSDKIVDEGPLPWADSVEVAIKIAGALETAHGVGVLHRDLKPENILLSSFGEPQLADFGIATVQGGTQTRSGVITASVAFASPEILDGKRATIASDVYSLGATLHTLITGDPPFSKDTDESLLAVMMRISRDPAPDLRANGVPDAVWAVIERSMAKDPAARPPTAAEFGRELQAAQRALGLPVTEMRLLRSRDVAPKATVVVNLPPVIEAHAEPVIEVPPASEPDPTPAPPLVAQPAPESPPVAIPIPVVPPPSGDIVRPRPKRRRVGVIVAGAVALVVIAAVAAMALMSGGGSPASSTTTTTGAASTTTTATTTTASTGPTTAPSTSTSAPTASEPAPTDTTEASAPDTTSARTSAPATSAPTTAAPPPETTSPPATSPPTTSPPQTTAPPATDPNFG